jgi:hypothetical protein
MILRDAIYAIKTIIKENNIDSVIEDEFLINRLNTYREAVIDDQYTVNNKFNPNWIQYIGVFQSEVINSADDPLISRTSIALSKVIIPQTIELKGMKTLTVRSGSNQRRINEVSMDRLFNMIYTKDDALNGINTYFRIGTNLYLYPILKYVSLSGILQNPLEAYTSKALIGYDGTIISPAGTKRNLTIDDEYPFDNNSLSKAITMMLKVDYNIMVREKEDLFPDGLAEKNAK